MALDNCIFCKIISGTISSSFIAQNDHVIVIKDISPKTPFHFLIIPKKHIADVSCLTADDKDTAAAILLMAQELSQSHESLREFRLVSNNGVTIGQSVFHIHFHFLAGTHLSF